MILQCPSTEVLIFSMINDPSVIPSKYYDSGTIHDQVC